MIRLIYTVFFIILVVAANGQKNKSITGLYGECEVGFFACEQIELKADSTFEYGLFYDVGGWVYWKGKWKVVSDTLILNSYNQPQSEEERVLASESYSFYQSGFITNLKFLIARKKLYTTDHESKKISKKYPLKKTEIENKRFYIKTD